MTISILLLILCKANNHHVNVYGDMHEFALMHVMSGGQLVSQMLYKKVFLS